ncbi:MAG: class I SAM-dependent methyltransferase [Bradyrhizobiaceae bacterium]|nr:class I SAM-dependent methyltransferase [Bradyrhizobiaceae bacterium]
MVHVDRRQHWDRVYGEKAGHEVSWFQAEPVTSLEFIRHCGGTKHSAIIDVGGGDSRLVDHLVADGFVDVTVLDLSAHAIARSKQRLGAAAERVHWITADITRWTPARRYRLWHDRAVLHFLTERKDREAYVRALSAAVEPGGCVVISTFALDGPERCSGLPVRRYSEEMLAEELGPAFELVEAACDDHCTPGGAVQPFQFSRFTRL